MQTLSVVMPSYNYANYLSTALEAILSQTYQPLEIIVIDDASSDGSVEVVKRYQKRSPLIRFYQNPQNLGVIATVNRGIDLAVGEYLAFCSADDETLPKFFEEGMSLLKKYPDAGVFSSVFCTSYDEQLEKLNFHGDLLSHQKAFLSPNEFFGRIKKKDIRLGGLNTIFHRNAVLNAGKFLPQLGPMCDWFLISVLALRHGVCFSPSVLTKMRIHKNCYSQVFEKDRMFCKELFRNVAQLMSEKEYRDVQELFIRSGYIYQIGLKVIPLLFEKKYRCFINMALIKHLFISFLKRIKHLLVVFFKNMRSNFQNTCP